ncbi:hypothetical protein, partial [Sphingobium sp.]
FHNHLCSMTRTRQFYADAMLTIIAAHCLGTLDAFRAHLASLAQITVRLLSPLTSDATVSENPLHD